MARVTQPITPEQRRKMVKLVEMGISYADIAARFGITKNYVSSCVTKGRCELKQEAAK